MAEINDIRFMNKTSLKQFYQNSKNNIEDPIFTGFTVEIDQLHSPLFFSVCKGVVDDTLRSSEGNSTANYRQEPTSTDRTKLSDAFETALKFMYANAVMATPEQYELRTLEAKDKFGEGGDRERRPGYGLFNKIYQDNVLYGAVDYIYMVDKVSVGTFSDDYGTTDIGNGTPNTNGTKYYSDLANQKVFDSIQSDVDGKVSGALSIDIYFENDISNIWDKQKPVVDAIVAFLEKNKKCAVNLKGYASDDDHATDEHNMNLSKRRIETITNAIKGVAKNITSFWYGRSKQPRETLDKNRLVICTITGDFSKEDALQLKAVQKEVEMSFYEEDHTKNENELKDIENKINNIGMSPDGSSSNSDSGSTPMSDYEKAKKNLENIPKEIENAKAELLLHLRKYQEYMSKLLTSSNSLNLDETTYNKTKQAFDEFVSAVNDGTAAEINGKSINDLLTYLDVHINVPEDKDIEEDIKKYKEKTKYPILNEEQIKGAIKILKSEFDKLNVKESTENLIRDYKKTKNEIEKTLYGIHPDGRLGTEFDPAPDSLWDQKQKAEEVYKTDAYQQKKQESDEIKNIQNNMKNIDEYLDYAKSQDKKDIERNLPSADITKEEQNSRELYEVPQTVYDMFGFIDGMDKMIHDYPYVMQSVTGLDEAYKNYFQIKDPYMGSGEGKITIDCLEYLDLRVSSMFNKYFNAAYDRQYRRERVPVNLRRFNCSIFVHDIRNFKDTVLPISRGYNEIFLNLKNIAKMAVNYLSAIEFKFYDCEIVPEETGNIFENVSNVSAGDMRTTKFTFTYGNCVINFLPFEDLRHYVLGSKTNKELKPEPETEGKTDNSNFKSGVPNVNESNVKLKEKNAGNLGINDHSIIPSSKYTSEKIETYTNSNGSTSNLDGNFRRWFDRSVLGNVNNNDYRDYIRHDSYIAVDDHFKTGIVNNFALDSLSSKNSELTTLNDSLRRMIIGISASTGIPVDGVPDALNVNFLKSILKSDDVGNVNTDIPQGTEISKNLGNVNDTEKGGN